ncbi:substrate-binding periplasmic protein [Alkalimarinus coralli]|uniref:substrate-binding periplasmic protein n=1 Tax=Alkalimarinus coralli TaxID=2935863 RepID=UPI00202AC497|nr:transporter substrate-binding domain-containing protein [Alkalimarinus coralli]
MIQNRIIFLVMILLTGSAQAETSTVTLATFDQEAPRLTVTEMVLREVYKKLNINLQVDKHPGNRALMLANNGKLDGTLIRSALLTDITPNLIKIPIPVAHVEYVAYTKKNKKIDVENWDSLTPYSIGILKGVKLIELRSKHLNTEMVTNHRSIFKMLYLERFDVALFTKLDGLYALKKMNLHTVIVDLSPPLEVAPAYHFLHRKHSTLIDSVSKLMQKMQNSGELQALIQQSERKVMESLPE